MWVTKKLKAILAEQDFHPTLVGLLCNPFYFARNGIRNAVQNIAPQLQGRCLDIGCGSKPYKRYYTKCTEYIGLEYAQERNERKPADFFYDGITFPFEDETFDAVVSNEVLEHVFKPQQHLAEVHRVIKPGGLVFMTIPFVWDENEQPWDFARYSSFGIKHLFAKAGFEVIEVHKTAADVTCLFQLINAYLYKITIRYRRAGKSLLITLMLNAPFNILGWILGKILPKNDDLYLDYIILAKKRL